MSLLVSLSLILFLFVCLASFRLYWDLIFLSLRRARFRLKYSDAWVFDRASYLMAVTPAYSGRNGEKQKARDEWALDRAAYLRRGND